MYSVYAQFEKLIFSSILVRNCGAKNAILQPNADVFLKYAH